MKYKVKDIKTRTIEISNDKEKLSLKMPFDFVITDEWIENRMKDVNLSKCENYLINKGFYLDNNNRWSYDGDCKLTIRLYHYFIDEEKGRLRLSFGDIKNCYSIKFPYLENSYCSIEEFPRSVPSSTILHVLRDLADKYDHERNIDAFILSNYKRILESGENLDFNDSLFSKIKDFLDLNIENKELDKYVMSNSELLKDNKYIKSYIKEQENIKIGKKVIDKYEL